MNEAEWLACADPEKMLDFLIRRASERKMRFFVMACARDLVAYRPTAVEADGSGSIEPFKAAIDRVEAYADGHGALQYLPQAIHRLKSR